MNDSEQLNIFQLLQREDEERYKPEIDQIKADLNGSMDLFRFIGNIVEVYVPRFFDMMVVTSGGSTINRQTPPEQTPPSSDGDQPSPRGPADPPRGPM